jgi:hypothetical protein
MDSLDGHMKGFCSSPEFREFFRYVQPFFNYIQEMRHYKLTKVSKRKESSVAYISMLKLAKHPIKPKLLVSGAHSYFI